MEGDSRQVYGDLFDLLKRCLHLSGDNKRTRFFFHVKCRNKKAQKY